MTTAQTKPRALRPGGLVGLVGPSGAIRNPGQTPDALAAKVEGLGFCARLGESVGQRYGYLSGTDEVRARDINRMFADPAVDAVYCVRGGYGTPRLLDMLDWDALRANPKPFIGYSDITAMHAAIHTLCGYPTLHGPMPCSDSLDEESGAVSRQSLLAALTRTQPLGALQTPPDCPPPVCLNPGVAEGTLVGGNLTLVTALLGTPYALDTRGKILFLEDIGEHTYALDRMLTQLRLSGALNACAGIALGQFTDCTIEYPDFGLTVDEVIRDMLLPCGKPVLAGLQIGHCTPTLSLPLGVACRLDATAGTLTLLQAPWRA
ncbi:MAG: LD-carboxypeptidase [Oscillospiraceae bacterium]|jgi:muramoyltetrapeptide carboxypeptidase|nr:LD-carboxypeptidase [Oscillospiraceae bacterium]